MKRTALSPAILAFLERDRIATLNLAGILRNQSGMEVFVDDEEEPKGILAKGPWFWYVHTEDDSFLEALFLEMERKEGFYRFSGVWRPLAEKIMARFPAVWNNGCDLYYLPPEHHRHVPATHPIRSVDVRDAETIDQNYAYRHSGSLEKIRACLQQRPSSAVYEDGEIVCWLLIHEDDSFGIMYTKEGHRRKGLAEEVTFDLIDKQLAAGRTPYLQIVRDNSLSPGLARKCGFVQYGCCDWFGVVVGTPPELVEGGIAFRRRMLESAATAEGVIQKPGFRVVLSGTPGQDVVLEPAFGVDGVEAVLAELRELGAQASPCWVVTPLDRPEAVEALERSGLLRQEAGIVCLCRFLCGMDARPLAANPVVEATDDQEWLAFASRHFDAAILAASLARLRKDCRLLWERREGAIVATAALLLDDEDGFELLWCSDPDPSFPGRVLEWAKAGQLAAGFVHVPREEQARFESLGFREVYLERRYRLRA